jgi:2'-5' RNA ligase
MVDFPAPGMPVKQTISLVNSCRTNRVIYEATGNYYKDTSLKVVMRVFVAVEISNNALINSIAKLQSEINIIAKPVEPQNLHFTIQFLGEITEEVSQKIKQALKTIKFSTFKVNFKGIGVFPKMKFPRVIWIGTDEIGANFLVGLAKKVANVLSPLGFIPDKPFKSHITIFRIKNKVGEISKELEKFKTYEFGSQEISNIKLKQSVLTPHGPIYSDLGEVKARN